MGVAQAQSTACGISQPVFCDTFDQPAATGNRSGQLNGTLWGVSRASGVVNIGQSEFNAWLPTQVQTCGGTTTVQPTNEVIVCNGQVREGLDDLTSVAILAMYPKQPFDFAGRTGIVTFDVSNDTQGTHTTWPELWITDQPVPTPFTHFASWIAAPRNGFGIRLAAMTAPGQGHNIAPACPNDANTRWSADSVVISRNYVLDDEAAGTGTTHIKMLDCVIASSGPGNMNHVEVHVSQNQIDVYATDAGTMAPLHHIAVVQNANLTFTRGLIWLEDVHYNADKFGQHNQRQHTFAWDNVGFDGPAIARDLTFDVLDSLLPIPLHPGELSLGWGQAPNVAIPHPIPGVSSVQNAAAALLTFNFFQTGQAPSTINYVVNGHAHSVAWPYPEQTSGTWRTLGVPVPLSDVLTGTNIVSISSNQEMVLSNIDLVLVAAGGGGCVCPSPPVTIPTGSPTSVASATPTATTTPTSVAGATATATATATPTSAAQETTPATPTSNPENSEATGPITPAGGFRLSARASSTSVAPESTQTIRTWVTSPVAAHLLIEIGVYDPSGKKVFQRRFEDELFAASQTKSYQAAWAVPGTAVKTTYTVRIRVFSADGTKLLGSNDVAAQFSVG